MDLCALILVLVLFVLAMVKEYLRTIPELYAVVRSVDLDKLSIYPFSQQHRKARRPFHVVLYQISADPPKDINLQAWDCITPRNSS